MLGFAILMTALRGRWPAGVFYLCFFLATASGRLGSEDAGNQLSAALQLVTAGRLSVDRQISRGWVRAPNRAFYEPHDIGNIVLMLPAAWAGYRIAGRPSDAVTSPPLAARALASLTCAVASALACISLFALFAIDATPRPAEASTRQNALLLSLAFPLTTPFFAYAKAAWDVLGACCAMCALLLVSVRIARSDPDQRTRDGVLVGLFAGVAASFRITLLPALAVAIALLLRRRLKLTMAAAATALVVLTPTLTYNAVRTGSFWRPATALPEYLAAGGNNEIGGNVLIGFVGLLASPNRGLFMFSPLCLLALTLPFVWRLLPEYERRVLFALGGGTIVYVAAIATLKNWGAFGWGPRYLVPVLPIAFFGSIVAGRVLWGRYRAPIVALTAASVVLSVAPALVNWSAAIAASPPALDQWATWPHQQLTVLREIARGGAGFPDFLIARMMSGGHR